MNKLNIVAPINSLGYGIVSKNIVKEMSKTTDIALYVIGNVEQDNDIEFYQQLLQKGYQYKDRSNAPCLKIWHEFDLSTRVGNGPYCVFPFFEINKLDQKRINHLSSVDTIVVASDWAKGVIKDANVSVPVHVVPLGVDSEIFSQQPQRQSDKCTFLNCGKWEKRKGHDVLLEMFKTAFPNEPDVQLIMMASNPFLNEKASNEWNRYYMSDNRVRLYNRLPSHHEVAKVMASSDCGIFPSRAEGWNLELLEMMAMGKHIITTNYSAHTEFCNKDNADLIDIEKLEPAEDGVFFDGSAGEWASLEGTPFEQGVEYMRNFYSKWKTDSDIVNTEGVKTAKQLTWSHTSERLKEIMYGN
tara:strand:- start:51 stop:1118 length:1068 start_codon:yes stop_codon:yes gene_type:complete